MRAGSSEESLSNGSQMCLCCSLRAAWIKAGFQSRKQEEGIPHQLIKCLEILRQAFFVFFKPDVKTNEERGTLYEPRPVSAAGSNFTSSSQGARLHFLLSFLSCFSSHLIHTFICPISRPLVNPLSVHLLGTCKSFALIQSSNSHPWFFSSVASADLCFASSLCPSEKDPRCRPGSPELVYGCTVLGNVGEVQRLVPAERQYGTCQNMQTVCVRTCTLNKPVFSCFLQCFCLKT